MRRQIPIAHQLYSLLYPHPAKNDPPSFSAHLAKNLVPEVRIEVATFYGDLNSTEARYPGLNYCHPPHRMRLARFNHHKRLFDAFEALGLTYNEVQEFCCWEGTKWARERYEKDEGVTVKDTTGDEIGPFVDRRKLRDADEEARRNSTTRKTEISVQIEHTAASQSRSRPPTYPTITSILQADEMGHDETNEEIVEAISEMLEPAESGQETPRDSSLSREQFAELITSHPLNQNLLAALGNSGNIPPEIEQYLKEESERETQSNHRSAVASGSSSAYVPLASSTASPASVMPRAAA